MCLVNVMQSRHLKHPYMFNEGAFADTLIKIYSFHVIKNDNYRSIQYTIIINVLLKIPYELSLISVSK